MEDYRNEQGRWVTVGGKRIFIKDGEHPEDAFDRTFGIKNPPKDEFAELIDKHKGEWDFRGEASIVDELESKLSKVRSLNSLVSLQSACAKWDKHITTLMEQVENGQDTGDIRNLMTLRRRVRMLQRQIKDRLENK